MAHSSGSKMMTDNQLNMSCTVAAENALLNWFLSPTCAMETSVLVTLVPMLAPIIIGMAGRTLITRNGYKSL